MSVFIRSGSSWNQQGPLLSGSNTNHLGFGSAIALSPDGNRALIGASGDESVRAFSRTAGTWAEGATLEPNGCRGPAGLVRLDRGGERGRLGRGDGHRERCKRRRRRLDVRQFGGRMDAGRTEANRAERVRLRAVRLEPRAVGRRQHPPRRRAVGRVEHWRRLDVHTIGRSVDAARSQVRSSAGGARTVLRVVRPHSCALPGWETGGGDREQLRRRVDLYALGSTWIESAKLTPSDGYVYNGGVALSADGNTALIGGHWSNDSDGGAAWIFTRTGSTWTQMGAKLTPNDAAGDARFGASVSLSATATRPSSAAPVTHRPAALRPGARPGSSLARAPVGRSKAPSSKRPRRSRGTGASASRRHSQPTAARRLSGT